MTKITRSALSVIGAITLLASSLPAGQIVVNGDIRDGAIRGRNDAITGRNIDSRTPDHPDEEQMRIGTTTGGGSSEPIVGFYIFRLPKIAADDVTSVSLAATLTSISNIGTVSHPTEGYGVDLYAIAYRPSPALILSDLYYGKTPQTKMGTSLIQQNFFRATLRDGGAKNVRLKTNAEANRALTAFVKQQLTEGGAGQYVFLRLTPSFDDARIWPGGGRGYNFATADHADPRQIPELTITTR